MSMVGIHVNVLHVRRPHIAVGPGQFCTRSFFTVLYSPGRLSQLRDMRERSNRALDILLSLLVVLLLFTSLDVLFKA